jgi:small subunit ribosomal protein S2
MTTLRQLLEAGVHFGHHVNRCNPKMKPYIHSVHGASHIIDLVQTQEALSRACDFLKQAKEAGKNIVFVGTKVQAVEIIYSEARMCGVSYVDRRWLGGMLTNFETLRKQIQWLKQIEEMKETGEFYRRPKKELALLNRRYFKVDKHFGGLTRLTGRPDVLFVIDQTHEAIAIKEARTVNCATVALVDTDSDPEGIDIVIPGNDDGMRSINLITRTIGDAISGLDSDPDPGPDTGPDLQPAPVPRRPLPYAGLLEIALALPDAEPDYLED